MQAFRRDRLRSAAASAAVVGGGLAGLVFGLGVDLPLIPARAALTAITTLPDEPPPPAPTPTRSVASTPKDSPAPEGRRAKATAIVAPPPRIVLPVTPPIVAAPNPGTGSQSSQGAGSAGSGSGAGGRGAGTGGGGRGGDGAGANSGVATYPRQTAGRIRFSDLPPDVRKSRTGADITVRYRIGVDGRVSGCTVVVSSGRADVDDGTCRRITERFRFRPARDARGNPVPFLMTETHGWDNVSDSEDEP
ncbi:energy transducer TonB [Novosphingobium sp.]|uniref:energy transducer TonB n=1 Tax=Novosphingobium sp. TaxID=1874826 RepID=UPI0028A7E42B|nr:energy transducer TonB [Novosphingobium sp.]